MSICFHDETLQHRNTAWQHNSPLVFSFYSHSVTVTGEKRRAFRGPAKVIEVYKRAEQLNKRVAEVEREMSREAIAHRRKLLKESLSKPFNDVRDDEMASRMMATANSKHKVSAKEAITGHDKAPLLDGEMPMGKIYSNKPVNRPLLGMELLGRWKARDVAAKGRELTTAEIGTLNVLIQKKNISTVKKDIWEDELKRWLVHDPERRKDDFQRVYLKPLFTSREDYDYELVKSKA